MSEPEVTLTCKPRSASALIEAVAICDPEHNVAYQPHDGLTHCNLFIHDVTALLGAPVPLELANAQVDYLAGVNGIAAGWFECGAITAADKADLGLPVVACWQNRSPKGHGHIALVVPRPDGRQGVYVAQAGATNFSCESARSGFGNLPMQFFWHG